MNGPDEPFAVAHWLALNEKRLVVDLNPVARARGWHLGHAQIDARGLGPEPGVAEVADSVGTPGDGTHQHMAGIRVATASVSGAAGASVF